MERGESLFRFGPFRLDAVERVLLRDGRLVPLSPKALSTLLVLVRNMGHVVEKDVLMAEVWPDEVVEEGNLAQHIFMLRKALGETNGSSNYIETVPRRGYRFVAQILEVGAENHVKATDSLAILPFSNASDDPNMEYLSEGITESIINILSQLPQLKVIARSAVSRYKDVAVDPQEVGRTFGVRAVMMGRVQQHGERLVIGAELIDVQDGSRIWGSEYHRKSSDIFSVQEELAWDISESLRLRLSGEQKEQLAKRLTENAEAYEFYLRGRYCWSKRIYEELKKGVEYFRQAIARDPNYSVAHAGMADCLSVLGLFGSEHPRLIMPQAKAAAMRAIQLDQTLGEAYASLAQVKFYYDWDWAGAEKDYQQAIRLSPTYSTAHDWYGAYLSAMGLMDEALTTLKRARDLNPLSQIINTNLGVGYYFARRYDLAIEQLKWAIELEPNFFRSHLHLGMAYGSKAMHREAIAELEKARSINENPWTIAGLGYTYASVGESEEAEKLIELLLEYSQVQYVSSATMAVLSAGFEDRVDQTLEWLEKAYEERAGLLVWLKVWPIFDRLRSNVRFVALLRRIGLEEASAEEKSEYQSVDPAKVELVEAALQRPPWRRSRNRRSTDGFDLQEDISTQPSQGLKLKAEREQFLTKHYAENSDPYQAYLQGRYCWSKHTREGLEEAIGYFRQAITLAPDFALGYAGIVDCYLKLATNYLPPAEALQKTESPNLAVEIDATHPQTQASIKIRCDWDEMIAKREHQRAVELKSEDLTVPQWHAAYLFSRSLYNDTLKKRNRGQDSTPDETRKLAPDVKLLAPPQYSSLTLAEEVQVFCVIARTQNKAGNYDAGCAVLERWWTMGEWPKLDGLDSHLSADLLFTAGTLAGNVSYTRQVPRGQKYADALLNGAIALFEQLGSRTLAVEASIELALCYYRESLLDLAGTTLIAALEQLSIDDLELRSFTVIRLAIVEWQSGRLQDALARLNEVAGIVELASPLAKACYHQTMGNVVKGLETARTHSAYFDQALAHYQEGLYLMRAIGHYRYVATSENNSGFLLVTLKRFAEAEIHLVRARMLRDALHDQVERAMVDETLAQLHIATQRFELAEHAILQSLETMEMGGNEPKLVESLTTLGLVLCRRGRQRKAKPVLERAYAVAERCGDREGAGLALLTEVEEMGDQLEDDELLELGARLDHLLADSQRASTLDRLRKCRELIASAHARFEAQSKQPIHA